ncbi:MAG: c-type cytochrome, partial [Gemmatimonadetes bacterium]|nr:c-type cytochrome [Gemmatimonadota bacterium]
MKRGLVVLVSGALAAPLAAQDASHTASAVERGQAMFDLICSACHSWDPPAKLAPPMSMVLGHYLERYADTDEASDAIAAWISGPDAERSVLPSHAVQQFGLMPGQPLPEAERRAVAAYLLDRAAREGVGIGMGRRAQADPPA